MGVENDLRFENTNWNRSYFISFVCNLHGGAIMTSPKPSSFKEERERAAKKYFHKYHGPDEEYEGWESEDYKAGYDACLRSQLVKDMATALEAANHWWSDEEPMKSLLELAKKAFEAYKKEVENE